MFFSVPLLLYTYILNCSLLNLRAAKTFFPALLLPSPYYWALPYLCPLSYSCPLLNYALFYMPVLLLYSTPALTVLLHTVHSSLIVVSLPQYSCLLPYYPFPYPCYFPVLLSSFLSTSYSSCHLLAPAIFCNYGFLLTTLAIVPFPALFSFSALFLLSALLVPALLFSSCFLLSFLTLLSVHYSCSLM
jgi:hypothetical protein